MQKIIFFSTFLVVLLRGVTTAQNPYESIGKPMPKGKILTLTNGKYPEVIENDTIVRIGSVMFNTVTNEVVAFVEKDTLHAEYSLEPDVVSRWLSPDPLAEKFMQWSPYNYGIDNPIRFTDPDGRSAEDHIVVNKKGQEIARKVDPSVHKVTIANTTSDDKVKFEKAVKMGTTYNLDGVISMYKSSAKDIIKVDKDGKVIGDSYGNVLKDTKGKPKQGIANEHGSYLKVSNGEVVAVGDIKGAPTNVVLDAPSENRDHVATAHSHPNEGKGTVKANEIYTMPFSSSGPSEEYDLGSQAPPKQGYYNIVIDKNNVYFYNKNLSEDKVITVPRSKF